MYCIDTESLVFMFNGGSPYLGSLIGWNWIIASKSRITFLHYFHKNLLCYNESWLSRKPALKSQKDMKHNETLAQLDVNHFLSLIQLNKCNPKIELRVIFLKHV